MTGEMAQLGDGEFDHRAVVVFGVDGQPDGVAYAFGEWIGVVPEEERAAAAVVVHQ